MTSRIGTLQAEQYTVMVKCRWILIRLRKVSHRRKRKSKNIFYVQ